MRRRREPQNPPDTPRVGRVTRANKELDRAIEQFRAALARLEAARDMMGEPDDDI